MAPDQEFDSGTLSSVAATSAMDCGRALGSFAMHRATSSENSADTGVGEQSASGVGTSEAWASKVAITDFRAKGETPVTSQ